MYQKALTGVAYSTTVLPKCFSLKKASLLLVMIFEAIRTVFYMIIVTESAGRGVLKHLKPVNTKVSGQGVLLKSRNIKKQL